MKNKNSRKKLPCAEKTAAAGFSARLEIQQDFCAVFIAPAAA